MRDSDAGCGVRVPGCGADGQQYLEWMQALECVLINPQQLSMRDFELVALVGRGAFGQVLQVRRPLRSDGRPDGPSRHHRVS
jgi:hypothetical protein